MPRTPRPQTPASHSLWDLDRCTAAQLAQRYADLKAFTAWLQGQGVEIPACWYTHGWVARRLAAVHAWKARAYTPDAHPRESADWWALGLAPLLRDWEPLLAHQGKHPPPDAPWDDPVPVPEFSEFVKAQETARARRDAEPGST